MARLKIGSQRALVEIVNTKWKGMNLVARCEKISYQVWWQDAKSWWLVTNFSVAVYACVLCDFLCSLWKHIGDLTNTIQVCSKLLPLA